MKTSFATAFALVASLASAAPSSSPVEARQDYPYASLAFQGAGPNPPTYFISHPADNKVFTIGTLSSLPLTT